MACPDRREGSVFRGGVAPSTFQEIYQTSQFAPPVVSSQLSDEDVAQLRNCSASSELPEHELRKSKRYAIATPISVIPMESDFRISGVPGQAYTIDVSAGGLSLLHPEPTTSAFYAIEFSDDSIRVPPVILRPIRCSRLGTGYAIAGEFVCRVEY